jgi:hypothetical protein
MNANPLKAKIMKLAYLEKTTFDINDITITFNFNPAILLNIFFNELKALNDGKCDTLIC